ncbi:MAG: RHS repeat-associated core domain-containing protein [Verrucomicrobiota bacterium]
MKTLRFLILGLLASGMVCQAQITDPGWFQADNQMPDAQPDNGTVQAHALVYNAQGSGQTLNALTTAYVPSAPIAEAITPQIQALADGLQHDPVQIFDYVHDNIRFVLYFGSKKGAALTLLEKSGNDFDQCALLMALLQASGLTNAQYQFGWQEVPYDDPNYQGYDLHNWWQLTLNNTVWTNTINYVTHLSGTRGYPLIYYVPDGNNNYFEVQRLWVALTIGATTYQLDPAFKTSFQNSGISLTNAMGSASISNALATAAGGTDTGNSTSGLSESNIRGKMVGYSTNMLNYLQTNYPNSSMGKILGGWQILSAYNPQDYTTNTTFPLVNPNGNMPVISWAYQPTNLMSTLTVAFAGTNKQWLMPQLQGQRLAMTFDPSGSAQLWLDDSNIITKSLGTGSGATNVALLVTHPFGTWNTTSNLFVANPTNTANQSVTNSYQSTNATYALLYAFEPDWGWLQQRQNKLDAYLQQGLTNGSRQVVSETLEIMGLNWMLQSEQTEQLLATQLGIMPQYYHRLGRMAQESGKGYYVDIYMQITGAYPSGGEDAAHITLKNSHFDLSSFFASALEHGLIEQLQNTNLVGASTVKMLQIANTNGQTIYLASSTNWTTGANVNNLLTNYSTATLNLIFTNYINRGFYVLLPQNGSNHVSSVAGSWAGYGYEARQVVNGQAANSQMIIAGGYHGGYSSDSGAVVNTGFTTYTSQNQAGYFTSTPILTPAPTGADPVDLANGTFQVDAVDLSLGQAEPRGITLSRYYNGARRASNPAGMAAGWLHNYCINAAKVAAPQAGLGGTTPAQAVPMLVATAAAIATYNTGYPNPKNWLVTALIAKWGVDQLNKNAVAVNFGKDTVQFIQQPNGTFTPPANCTMTLTQSGSTYSLRLRHGNTFNFNAAGLLTNIVDQYNQSLNLTYTNSNVKTASDWKGRSLTFGYTSNQLTSVSDGTRTVNYGYSTAYNSQGDLTSFTDAEGKTTTYAYDTNHQITATIDAKSQVVVSNIYDGQGHIATQYTQGDTNKTWRVLWSDYQTTTVDPAGGKTDYYFDSQHRLTAVVDPLNNETDTYYDGQNHIIITSSPLFAYRYYYYDGNNNVTQYIDPLNYTNQYFYDTNNNLIRSVDPRGNPTTYGYNTNFSITGQTNGAGDWVNYTYNTDGTLHTRTDAGGTTTYDTYDAYGQLSHITYPGSLGGESFGNSSFGDVTSHTDARSFVNSFKYNNRRQLTNAVAPTNVTVSVSFDAVGNAASATDARNNASINTWSPTRHLLATALPSTPQGSAIVTNIYDPRDYLVKTLDPYQQATFYTNDANGRTISVTDPVQRTTTFGYDADGRKLSTTNAANETTRQTWDKRGNLIQLTDGAGHFSIRAYDAAGNQTILTNRNGKIWQFQFDGANRLTNTVTPRGRSSSLTFNHQGLVATTKDPANQTTSFNYDGKGRLTSRTDNIASTAFSYDANDNRTSVVENGLTNSWAYDAYNHVSSYKDVYGNLIQYRYDANGNVTNLVYPGGKNVYYSYDNLNQLTNVTDWSQRKTSISYDLAGRIKSIIRPNGSCRTIGYDVAGQATNIMEQMSNSLPIAIFKHGWTNSGSLAWEFAAPLPHSGTVPTRTMTYDDDNRLLTVNGASVTNDADGNLTYAPLTNGTFVSQTFDPRNRLLNAGGVTNAYDALNNRIGLISGTNSTVLVVNPNAKLPQVLIRIKNGVTNYYIYGAGLLYQVTETATGTNTLTYHYDYRGSTIALSADNSLVTDRIEYSAYGLTTYRVGLTDTPFLFNGRYGVQTDPNGLLYMRARYYNPYLCRFVSADPTGFAGGLNHYAYANGNPISLLDPFGLGAKGESFWSWIGSEYQGVASAAQNFSSALYNTVTSPIDTASSIAGALIDHPYETSQAIAGGLQNTWSDLAGSDPQAQGQAIGNLMFFAASTAGGVGTRLSTAAERTPVFWSGGRAAEDAARTFANANNGIVIGDTAAGRALAQSTAGVPWSQARPQWQSLSESFARSASGEVNVFQNARGVSVDSIWRNEYQILRQNNVQINFNVVMPNGSVAPVP